MRRARMVVACGCTLMVGGAWAVPAHAGTLYTYEEEYEEDRLPMSQYVVQYVGSAGEFNRVVATYDTAARTFTLTDTGALTITPSATLNNQASELCTFEARRVTCRHSVPGDNR